MSLTVHTHTRTRPIVSEACENGPLLIILLPLAVHNDVWTELRLDCAKDRPKVHKWSFLPLSNLCLLFCYPCILEWRQFFAWWEQCEEPLFDLVFVSCSIPSSSPVHSYSSNLQRSNYAWSLQGQVLYYTVAILRKIILYMKYETARYFWPLITAQ